MSIDFTETTPLPENCPLCDSKRLTVQYARAHDYITGDVFTVWQCDVCGIALTYPKPIALDRYYPTHYRQYHPLALWALEQFYKMRVRSWTRSFKRGGRALEIGCGDGFMLHLLKWAGWEVLGTERTPEMAQRAMDLFDVPVIVSDPTHLASEGLFDLIILFQVLEHLGNPLSMLEACVQLLSPNGVLVIGVPNFASWQSAFGRDSWLHLDVPRHLFHYSPTSLRKALERVGLCVIDVNFISLEHDPFGWVQTILNRLGFEHNALTRLLMRTDHMTASNLLQIVLAAVLIIPSSGLAGISWMVSQGAIMQVVSRLQND